ncbi:MAG: DUF6074 family protein [Parvibaculum sp.]
MKKLRLNFGAYARRAAPAKPASFTRISVKVTSRQPRGDNHADNAGRFAPADLHFVTEGMGSVRLNEDEAASAAIRLFPMERRQGRIEAVATALQRASNDRVADRYAGRVAQTMFAELELLGLPELAQDEAVGAFFHEVDQAIAARRDAEPWMAEIISLR